jgi:phosphate transport system substrate-binding protein
MLKRFRVVLSFGGAVVISLIISACGSTSTAGGTTSDTTATASSLGTPGSYNCLQGSITASGSTALAPLIKAIALEYESHCSGATISVKLGGSQTGLANVEAGSVDIGNSDIPAASNQSDLVDHQVAVVIFGVIVNKDVTLTNLTTAQLKQIYSGQVQNWSALGGPNLPIAVVSRPASSGTRTTFQKYVLGGSEIVSGPASLTSDTTGTVVTEVGQTNGAIAYAATGPVQGKSNVTLLSIDGVAPTANNTESNRYKFWNIEHMYTKGQPKPLAQALIDYMASSDAKNIEAIQQFVSMTTMSPDAMSAHNAMS